MARGVCTSGRTAEREALEQQECPFLHRYAGGDAYPLLGYCLAYGDGRLRSVTIAEFRDCCTGPGHRKCRTYQVRIAQEAAGTAAC